MTKEGDSIDTTKLFKKVGTHNGRFHADEVMATAILKQAFEVEVTRTRDMEVLSKLDIVYDVGGGEFDHHDAQKVYREDGIPYAASGLIWNKFGHDVLKIKAPELSQEDIEACFGYIDRILIKGIDALDNGVRLEKQSVHMMNISLIISMSNPPWHSNKSEDEAFSQAVDIASYVLDNTINNRLAVFKARETIEKSYKNRDNPQILVLDINCPWEENLRAIDEGQEVLFVIYPEKDGYVVQTVRDRERKARKDFPRSWAGKRDQQLADITGVEDAVFCHSGRFLAVSRSYEGAVKLANIAIDQPEQKPLKPKNNKESLYSFIISLLPKKRKKERKERDS